MGTPVRRSTLLDFESDTDLLFASAFPSAPTIDGASGGMGASLRLEPGTRQLSIKLASLMSGRDFPADWTLLTLSLRAERSGNVRAIYEVDGAILLQAAVPVRSDRWTPATLDLTQLPGGRDIGTVSLRFEGGGTNGVIWVDEVALLDNTQIVLQSEGGWSIREHGLKTTVQRESAFAMHLLNAAWSAGGWELIEANVLRASFRMPQENDRVLAIYRDGRVINGGRLSGLSASVRDDPRFAASHEKPAELRVPEEMGRVDRAMRGDSNNDGYDEALGVYTVVAAQRRVDVTFLPRGNVVPRPVLQIAGLPEGSVRVTAEGRLVEQSVRLPDGQVLIMLPLNIERPTTISARVQ